MALPKYLPVKKKIPYTVRLPEHLLNSLNAYADLTGNTTTKREIPYIRLLILFLF